MNLFPLKTNFDGNLFSFKDPPPWNFEAARQTSADKSGIPDQNPEASCYRRQG